MGRNWRLRDGFGGVTVMPRHDLPADLEDDSLPPEAGDGMAARRSTAVEPLSARILPTALALARLPRWLADAAARRDALEVLGRVSAVPMDRSFGRSLVLFDRLARAFERGLLVALLDPPSAFARDDGGEAEAEAEPAEPLPPPVTPADQEASFAIEVLDERGDPVDGLELEFRFGGERRRVTTDGSGIAKVEHVRATSAFVTPAAFAALRDLLFDRKRTPRDVPEPSDTVTVARLRQPFPMVDLAPETQATLVITRPLHRVRLIGMFFETSKAFVLPSAMRGIRGIKRVYDEHPDSNLLIVGHTDRAGNGDYNETLSLERAEALAAFLTDDVQAWLAWYGSGKPAEKRWGNRETQHMLTALPEGGTVYYPGEPNGLNDGKHQNAVTRFQNDHDLEDDGVAGPITREALVKTYMALDSTTLPEGVSLTPHGCGEHFPEVPTVDGASEPQNRRVEVFVFDGPIDPPPPGKTSKAGSTEYPEWKALVTDTTDFREEDRDFHRVEIHLRDEKGQHMKRTHFQVTLLGETTAGVADDGVIEQDVPGTACPGDCVVEWGSKDGVEPFPFVLDVILDCEADVDPHAQAEQRLHNLGYPRTAELNGRVIAFQIDNELDERGLDAAGRIPDATQGKIQEVYESTLSA